MKTFDIVFVGSGFRTTTFLASNPDLLKKNLCIVEQTHALDPGSFRDLSLTSSSNGSSFFRHVDPLGAFGWLVVSVANEFNGKAQCANACIVKTAASYF